MYLKQEEWNVSEQKRKRRPVYLCLQPNTKRYPGDLGQAQDTKWSLRQGALSSLGVHIMTLKNVSNPNLRRWWQKVPVAEVLRVLGGNIVT